MSWTTVHISNPVPRHASKPHWRTQEETNRCAGQTIRIELPPRTAFIGWSCNTNYIWRLHPEDVEKLGGTPPFDNVYACEHQLELD